MDTAFSAGFKSGRLDYENMNGLIFRIPQRIVTEKF
jgi:hypothetical protein